MSLFDLLLRFIYVGLFTVGGGLASIPLLLQVIVEPGYLSEDLFYFMIAISESTPGPIGVKLAAYIGYDFYGVMGSLVTMFGIVLPCFVISFMVSKAFARFSGFQIIKAVFYGVRPVVVGLIAVAAYAVLNITVLNLSGFAETGRLLQIVNWKALVLFGVLIFFVMRFKKHSVVAIVIGAVAGVLLF